MVHQVGAELAGELLFGDRHADGIGDALAERAGRRLDAGGVTIFRVAGGLGAHLAELLDVLDGHVLVACQIEQAVEEHRTVAGRQDEAVAVRPERVLRVEVQIPGEENGGDVGAAHRHAGVAGIGFFHRVHGEETDRIGHPVVFFGRDHGCSACSGSQGTAVLGTVRQKAADP
ncbi:hypothetical protein D3C72_1416910 [compost metagenome]